MWHGRIGLIMLVAVSLVWTGMPAVAGPGRKVGPPSVPPARRRSPLGKRRDAMWGLWRRLPGKLMTSRSRASRRGTPSHTRPPRVG